MASLTKLKVDNSNIITLIPDWGRHLGLVNISSRQWNTFYGVYLRPRVFENDHTGWNNIYNNWSYHGKEIIGLSAVTYPMTPHIVRPTSLVCCERMVAAKSLLMNRSIESVLPETKIVVLSASKRNSKHLWLEYWPSTVPSRNNVVVGFIVRPHTLPFIS